MNKLAKMNKIDSKHEVHTKYTGVVGAQVIYRYNIIYYSGA
jgi:hypothetical protein